MNIDDQALKELRWTAEDEANIRGPYEYLQHQTGKKLRSMLVRKFNGILSVPADKLAEIESLIDILHTSSLLVDDVEDHATLRRGKPAGHLIFGTPVTINSANYMYFVAMNSCLKLSPHSTQIFLEEMVNLHRGQGLDLYWRESLKCPREDEYVNMVMNKTGGLFRLAVRLLQDNSESAIDLVPFTNLLGIIYQIRDDLLNLTSYAENKGFCEDITEGKFSFPIIHSIRTSPTDELINILKLRTTNDDLKKYAVELMRDSTDSFKYCEDSLANLQDKAILILQELQEDGLKAQFDDLQDLVRGLCAV